MIDFRTFRNGVGGSFIESITGTSVKHINSWSDLEITISRGFEERNNFEDFIIKSKKIWEVGSSAQVSLLIATIYAMGYSNQFRNITGTENPSVNTLFDTYGEYALACAACIARID